MATHDTPSRNITAAQRAMFAQRNQRIVRAGWRESALAAEIRTNEKLVGADKDRQQSRQRGHQSILSRVLFTTESSKPSSSARSITRDIASRPVFRVLTLTSTRTGENAATWIRKVSRTNRLIRLRATEDFSSLFGTDIAIAPKFPASCFCVGENRHSKSARQILFPDFKIVSTSACFNRFRRGKGNNAKPLKIRFADS